ncbi:metallophosphatase domain-containing protein [Ochrobactrum phage vB_OspM_OC]|nr:metallophosphatase domain-containing protein [Ochrobactrum phage vB_OspM_OC]
MNWLKAKTLADTHFFHTNIIRYCNRPFDSVDTMNVFLIRAWNESIAPDDVVIFGGDFTFCLKPELIQPIFDQLNGEKIMIKGNHDPRSKMEAMGWTDIRDSLEIEPGILFTHYPVTETGICEVNIHGHVHGAKVDYPLGVCGIDVGVDSIGYHAITIEEAIRRAINPNT